MKHNMNKMTGYYQGPPGVFYDRKHDEIFILTWDTNELHRRIKNKFVKTGRAYRHITDNRKKLYGPCTTVMIGFDYIERLGEL